VAALVRLKLLLLECPNQEEVQVPGEAESLVEEEDLLGEVASNWLTLVGNH